MSWGRAMADFMEHMRSLGRTRATLQLRSFTMQKFRRFCEAREIHTPLDVSTDDAEAFWRHLRWEKSSRGQLYTAHSVHCILSGVHVWFRWLVRTGRMMFDPFRTIINARVTHPGRPVPSEEAIALLLEQPDVQTPSGLRDRALLELFYCTGVRLGECGELEVADVDLEQRALHVRLGKGQLARVQPVGDQLAVTLEQYLLRARPVLLRDAAERGLWIGDRGRRIHAGQIGRIVHAYKAQLGLEGVSPHRLRAAFATHLLEGGAHVEDVQRLMGHARLQSTYTYTRLTPAQVFQEHSRTHPRARRPR